MVAICTQVVSVSNADQRRSDGRAGQALRGRNGSGEFRALSGAGGWSSTMAQIWPRGLRCRRVGGFAGHDHGSPGQAGRWQESASWRWPGSPSGM